MRKSTVDVFKSWMEGKRNKKSRAVWTDGQHVYSYGTPVLWIADSTIHFNVTRYSRTTTNHQNGLRQLMVQHSRNWVEVNS